MNYFFTVMPIEAIHHDDRINPRAIGPNLRGLIEEFHKGRPQLHVALGWIEIKAERWSFPKLPSATTDSGTFDQVE